MRLNRFRILFWFLVVMCFVVSSACSCSLFWESKHGFYFTDGNDENKIEYLISYDSYTFLDADNTAIATETLTPELFPKKIGGKYIIGYYWDEDFTEECTMINMELITKYEHLDFINLITNIYCETVNDEEANNSSVVVKSTFPEDEVTVENNKLTFRINDSSINIYDLISYSPYCKIDVSSSSYNNGVFTFDANNNDINALITVTSLSQTNTNTYEFIIHRIQNYTISFNFPYYPNNNNLYSKDITKEDDISEVFNENSILSLVQGYDEGAAIFEGWYTDSDFTNKANLKDGDTLFFDKDQKYYAKFSCRSCVLSFEGLSVTEDYTFASNILTKYPDTLVPEGYNFAGWESEDIKFDKDGKPLTDFYCDKNVTLNPIFEAIIYTISYVDDDIESIKSKNYTITDLPVIEFPTLNKEWYEFKGWTRNKDSNEIITSISEIENVTLYSVWQEKVFYAEYYNGNDKIASIPFTYSSLKWVDPDVPDKFGYISSWEAYDIKSETIIINAIYKPIEYKINYSNLIGGNNVNPNTYTIESEIIINLPEVLGYDILGFYNENNEKVNRIDKGTTGDLSLTLQYQYHTYMVNYYNGDKLVDTKTFTLENYSWETPVCSTKDYYTSEWESIPSEFPYKDIMINVIYTPIEYEISYENTNEVQNNNQLSYNIESEFDFQVLTKDGYKSNFKVNNNDLTGISKGMHGDLIVYVDWIPIVYTASFYAFNELIGTSTFTIENKVLTIPEVPHKDHYQDGKWEEYNLTFSDVRINAIYSPITYTIIYLGIKSATNPNPIEYNIESDDIILEGLTLDMNTFIGFKNESGEKVEVIKKGTFGDIILNATWDSPIYTVNYYSNEQSGLYITMDIGHGDYLKFPNQDPILEDGTFKGWYNQDFTISYNDEYIVTSDLDIYAKWDICISIETKEDLYSIANNPSASYQLKNDINLKGEEWIPLQTFTGIILGNNHKIYNFTISNNNDKSAFIINNQGILQNIIFTNVEYRLIHTGSGYSSIVTCINNGKITNVSVLDSFMTVIYKHYNNELHSYTGAIAANNTGLISNCNVEIELKATYEGSFSNQTARTYFDLGGIVGFNSSIIENCEAIVEVTLDDSVYHGISGYQAQSLHTFYSYIFIGGIVGNVSIDGSIIKSKSNLSLTSKTNASIGSSGFGGHGVHQRYRAIGGVVGNNNGIIEKCSSIGWVKRSLSGEQASNGFNNVGGICGITCDQSSLNIVSSKLKIINTEGIYGNFGGICGVANSGSTIKNASYYGTIQLANNSSNIIVGGIIGINSGLLSQTLMHGEIIGLECKKGDIVGINNADGAISRSIDEGNLGVIVSDDKGISSKCYIMGVDIVKESFYNANYIFNEIYFFDEDKWDVIEGIGICLKQFVCNEHEGNDTINENQVCPNDCCGYIIHNGD